MTCLTLTSRPNAPRTAEVQHLLLTLASLVLVEQMNWTPKTMIPLDQGCFLYLRSVCVLAP